MSTPIIRTFALGAPATSRQSDKRRALLFLLAGGLSGFPVTNN
jgi:hypothetical protein